MVKTVRVGIIGGGMISHRHMQIYKNINERAEELPCRDRCSCGDYSGKTG